MNSKMLRITVALILGLLAVFGMSFATATAGQPPPNPQTLTAAASGNLNLEIVGHVGGSTESADVLGAYAYIGEGTQLTILDISDPAAPEVVSKKGPWSSLVDGVAVASDGASHVYAYVTVDHGLAVVDVSTSGAPTQVGFVDTGGGHHPVVSGTHVYVPESRGGIAVVDVSEKTAPEVISQYSPGGGPAQVAVSGDYLYVVGGLYGGFDIINISNPAHPTLVKEFTWVGKDVVIDGDKAYLLVGWNGDDYIVKIDISDPENVDVLGWHEFERSVYGRLAVRGDYLYVLGTGANEIHVFDVSPPLTPTLKGTFETWGDGTSNAVGTVVVDGAGGTNEWLYTANGRRGFRVAALTEQVTPTEVSAYDPPGAIEEMVFTGDHVYVADGNALSVLDVSTPSDPQPAGAWLANEVRDIVVTSTLATLASGEGLHLVDVSQPFTPTAIVTGYGSSVQHLAVSGHHAYEIVRSTDLDVIDISNPLTPTTAKSGYQPFEDGATHYLYDVAALSNTVYAVSPFSLVAVDVTTPSTPTSTAVVPHIAGDEILAITGTVAYLGGQYEGVEIVDLAAEPTELSSYAIPDSARSVEVAGDYVYAAGSHLRVIDVSQPSAPVEVGNYDEQHIWSPVVVTGTHAYFAGYDSAASQDFLGVLDISDPIAPTEVGAYDLPGSVKDIVLTDSLALLAIASPYHLHIADISTPMTPTFVSTYTMQERPMDVEVLGRYAYVLDDDANVSILDISDPHHPNKVGAYEGDDLPGTTNYDPTLLVQNSLLYVTTDGYLHILDVTNLGHPVKLVSKSVTGHWGSSAGLVAVASHYVYVTADDGLVIFDVSDPQSPRKVGAYAEEANDMILRGDYAYLAAPSEGLRVLDVSDPVHLTELGFYDTNGGVVAAYPDGKTVWLADSNGGLRWLDVSDLSAPRQLGYTELSIGNEDIEALGRVGETFYLASSSYGVYVLQAATYDEKVYLPLVLRQSQ